MTSRRDHVHAARRDRGPRPHHDRRSGCGTSRWSWTAGCAPSSASATSSSTGSTSCRPSGTSWSATSSSSRAWATFPAARHTVGHEVRGGERRRGRVDDGRAARTGWGPTASCSSSARAAWGSSTWPSTPPDGPSRSRCCAPHIAHDRDARTRLAREVADPGPGPGRARRCGPRRRHRRRPALHRHPLRPRAAAGPGGGRHRPVARRRAAAARARAVRRARRPSTAPAWSTATSNRRTSFCWTATRS